ncbi:MAG: DUF4082 domain-containing protein, partial [bacterium]
MPLGVPGPEENDSNAVEVGIKFRADVDGTILGMRFYKTPNNTGTHTGNLWTSGATNLGTVLFSGETATGWQTAYFDTPIVITADTTYVVSYHTTSGYYVEEENFFTNSGVDNPPLHALADGVDGSNGIYSYSGVPTFPTDTFNSSNYGVDVLFATEIAPDTTPPTV